MPGALRQLLLPFEFSPLPEPPGHARQVRLADRILSYRLVRARRRTIALFIHGDGVEARAPRHVSVAEIEAFIRAKERWIRRRLAAPRRPAFVWEDGTALPWLGRQVALSLHAGDSSVRLDGDRVRVGLADGAGLRGRVLAWIREQAQALFCERVAALAHPLGLCVSAVGLSNARTQWGSCSAAGRVLLNWRLMLLPPHLIDYVVAHELAHRRELNHSARFWEIVTALCPEHRAARRELNALAKTLPEL